MKHKHYDLIVAWAGGAEIEMQFSDEIWRGIDSPSWHKGYNYRIKPEPKPDYQKYFKFQHDRTSIYPRSKERSPNLVLHFDGETNELKSAEVLK